MWNNEWKKGVDYPSWGDTDEYKKTITGGKQMKERILKIFGSLFLFTLLIGCVKEQNCTVTKIYSGDESIKNISNTNSLTITVIEKEYVVLLECY